MTIWLTQTIGSLALLLQTRVVTICLSLAIAHAMCQLNFDVAFGQSRKNSSDAEPRVRNEARPRPRYVPPTHMQQRSKQQRPRKSTQQRENQKPSFFTSADATAKHRVGLDFTLHALSFAKSTVVDLQEGFVLVNPEDEIIAPFTIDDVSRLRLSYDYSLGYFDVGGRLVYALGGPEKLSWSELRASALFTPKLGMAGYFVGPNVGIGTLRMDGTQLGNSIYIGVEGGYKFHLKKGLDVGIGADTGWNSINFAQNGIVVKSNWLEFSIRALIGFSF